MATSKSYFEWSISATKLDALDGTSQQQRWRQVRAARCGVCACVLEGGWHA